MWKKGPEDKMFALIQELSDLTLKEAEKLVEEWMNKSKIAYDYDGDVQFLKGCGV